MQSNKERSREGDASAATKKGRVHGSLIAGRTVFFPSESTRSDIGVTEQQQPAIVQLHAGLIVSPGRTGDRCHCVGLLPVTSLLDTVNTAPLPAPSHASPFSARLRH